MAQAAVNDLLAHFWTGTSESGHIVDTYAGIGGHLKPPDEQGILWERATFIATLEDLYQVTREPALRQRIAADWAWVKKRHTPEQLEACGGGSRNPGHDDAGWSAMMYLNVYRATRDPEALTHARALFLNACDRWTDPRFDGALRGSDTATYTTSYQAALILAGVRIYERTHDMIIWNRAVELYEHVEKLFLRPDGLYWWVVDAKGPRRLGEIREARSEVFLGGNMAMGVIHARLFHLTHQRVYLRRAIRTAQAIREHETSSQGIYLNDRDAWANGYFMGEWAREVLTLPGIGPEHAEILRKTARSIWEHARTARGYYGACWAGPPEGNVWDRTDGRDDSGLRSTPEQIMTSATTVNVLVAAAAL